MSAFKNFEVDIVTLHLLTGILDPVKQLVKNIYLEHSL